MLIVPRDGDLYARSIEHRCKQLIDSGIWAGITRTQLDTWLRNFITPEEKYFAACMLDAVIYRSRDQTLALAQQLFQRSLADLSRTDPSPLGDSVNWLALFRDTLDPSARLVPVIRDNDPPTKSGPLICRMYKRSLRLRERWMVWPWQIGNAVQDGIRTFIFVDDFLGTGTQVARFCRNFDIEKILDGAHAVYAPLTAHERGVANLRTDAPFLRVCCAETIRAANSLFDDSAPWFADGTNSPRAAWDFYTTLIANRALPVPEEYLSGFGRLGLAYAFEHAVPNNCVPLLWFRTPNWEPLLER